VTHAKLKLKDVGAPENFSDTTVNLGLDVRGGVNFHFTGQNWPGSLAIFLEYRFTQFEPSDFKDNVGGVPIKLEVNQMDTHHIVTGVGWYF
jgi:opacity protein-like surface antigen